MSVATIFGAFNAASSIAGYLGLIDSVSGDVKKLLHQSLESAIQNLRYAQTASDQNKIGYIQQARDKFIEATAVESNENLISALVGLSMCQHLLGDSVNSRLTFQRIKEIELSKSEKAKASAKEVAKHVLLPSLTMWRTLFADPFNPVSHNAYTLRKAKFEEYKALALSTQ